jgi:histone deacetylase 11
MRDIQPRIVYSPKYNIRFLGLEKLHPFDSCKYANAWQHLLGLFGNSLENLRITPTEPVSSEELLTVHTPEYLKWLKNSIYLAKALELPELSIVPRFLLEKHILYGMQLATKGTIIAAQWALSNGIAVNLSGGYHHASSEKGEGFCIYSDVAIAINSLRQSELLQPDDAVMIIDLDAHQGNGVERVFSLDKSVHILDMYNQNVYPQDWWAVARIDCDIPLNSHTKDEEYLDILYKKLPAFIEQVEKPKIAFYNAGTDIYEEDSLGGLSISKQAIFERDKFVFDTLTKAGIPWVMVLSGGYTKQSYLLVAESVAYMLKTWCFN